ncbi:MAG TPA: aminopeptidase [Moraxellaceae bacterium]|nr:aminopeptidase [Moraxellaceae bacterium]
MKTPSIKQLFSPLLVFLLTGCQSAAYYGQSVQGHFNLLAKRKPIDQLLDGDAITPGLRRQLEAVQRIRIFARDELGLPARRQYDHYVELGQPYPVWSVMAAPELSLQSRTWCYWFVGCLSYRGFFAEADAQRLATLLEQEGWEVYLSGIPAYSTLGWFRDPVLSSFVHQPEAELAELIFHELTHQVLFVPGDTVFNESLAVAVADEGLRRYSERHPQDLERLQLTKKRRDDFVALVLSYRKRLQSVFALPISDSEKRVQKDAVYADLRQAYAEQKIRWDGYAGYDGWFAAVNNARLSTVGTYHDLVPAFRLMIRASGDDLSLFFDECRKLARLKQAERHQYLRNLLPEDKKTA